MFFVMLAWIAQILVLSGIGWLVYADGFRLNDGAGWSARDFFRSFWTGFGVLLAAAQFYSLVFPVKGLFLALAGAVALPGLWRQACAAWTARSGARMGWRSYAFWTLLALCALRVAAGLGALEWNGAYDSDLYHFSVVRWTKEYAAVPGLANLHAPLGGNSAYLLFASIMDHGAWYRRSAWIVPGVFVVMFVAQLLWTVLVREAAARRARVFSLLLLSYAVLLINGTFPNLYYDRPAFICMGLAILELLDLAPSPASGQARLAGIFAMLLMAALSVSIKPVGVVAAALLGLAGLRMAWHLPWRAAWLCVFALPVVLAAGLLARNAVLSGWLFFPSPHGALPVSWAVPEHAESTETVAVMHSVRGGYALLRAWSRRPGPEYRQALTCGTWQWVPAWLQRQRHDVELKLLAGGLLCLALALIVAGRREADGRLLFAILLTGATLVFWFFTAPDLRFGGGYFWLLFALAGTLLLTRLARPQPALALAAMLGALAVWLAHPGPVWPKNVSGWRIGHALEARCHWVQIQNGQQPPLKVWVPDNGDLCGDGPLPGTPYPLDTLCCRVPGDLRHGFYIAPRSAKK